jgi:hypothetical protein
MKISGLSIACLITAFFSAQVSLVLFFENLSLRKEIRISQKAKELTDDQIDELTSAISSLRIEKEAISTRQFIAGLIESFDKDKKDYLNALWHDGYDRGSSVMSYTIQIDEKNKK